MRKTCFVMMVAMIAITWNGCDSEVDPKPVDCNANPVTVQVVSVQDSECGLTTGSIEVTATGGNSKYRFKIGDGNLQPNAVFNSLGAGLYEITAVDENNCSATMEVAVKNKDGVNMTFDSDASGCKTSNGTVTVTATGGTPPYEYKLDAGQFSGTSSFSALAAGEHNLTVKDATGCEINQVVRIRSGVSYSNSVAPIIQGSCAISGCHNGTQFPDFRVFKNVQDNAGKIKTLTQNGTMPQQGTLTQEQKDLIACWVDDGALDN